MASTGYSLRYTDNIEVSAFSADIDKVYQEAVLARGHYQAQTDVARERSLRSKANALIKVFTLQSNRLASRR